MRAISRVDASLSTPATAGWLGCTNAAVSASGARTHWLRASTVTSRSMRAESPDRVATSTSTVAGAVSVSPAMATSSSLQAVRSISTTASSPGQSNATEYSFSGACSVTDQRDRTVTVVGSPGSARRLRIRTRWTVGKRLYAIA